MADARSIETVRDFINALREGPYTSVGCYPIFFLCEDGEPLSYKAAKEEVFRIARAIQGRETDKQWRVTHQAVNWEDPELYCSHSGERIESAYAEPDGET